MIQISEDEYKELLRIKQRYDWIKENTTERMIDKPKFDDIHPGCEYALPTLVSWKEFCGQISFDEAIDIKLGIFE